MNHWSQLIALKEPITFFIALFGFLLSLWNFFFAHIKNRFNVQIECKDFVVADHLERDDKIPLYISLTINNKSALPLSISRIFITINNQTFEFTWVPQVVHRSQMICNNNILDSTIVKTHPIPVQIPCMNLISGYFCAFIDKTFTNEDLLCANCSITLHTNRKIKTFDLALPKIAQDI